MLNDPKSKFRYVPAISTDIRKTFARVRKSLREQQPPPPPSPAPEPNPGDARVLSLHRKRGAQ